MQQLTEPGTAPFTVPYNPQHDIGSPGYSDWTCDLFGNYPHCGISYRPLKGKEPNWFWRKMQFLILGHRWIKS